MPVRAKSNVKIAFQDNLIDLEKLRNRYIVLHGGRGGAKSWSIAATLILRAMNEKHFILCTREVQNSIHDSVHKLLEDTISRYGFSDLFNITRNEISCINGSSIIFKGLKHNYHDIQSTEGVTLCWIEEAHSISQASLDVLIPTIRKENSQIYISYNPKEEKSPVHQMFVVKKHPLAKVIQTNYYDNPYFSDVLRDEMEYCKKNDPDKYRHIWCGEPEKISDACVFKGKYIVHDFQTPEKVKKYYGGDWGFASDPSVCLSCYETQEKEGPELWIDHEVYGVGVEIDELPQMFQQVPGAMQNVVRADSARPETISFMNKRGWTIRPAQKGDGSIKDGIEFIRSYRMVHIHDRCKNTAYEFGAYSYKVDALTGEPLKILVDKHNHCIDSLRYALEEKRKSGGSQSVSTIKLNNLRG